ncbi:MAG: molybdopterin-dependent oxidoreductase [Ferruginibacter sp.]
MNTGIVRSLLSLIFFLPLLLQAQTDSSVVLTVEGDIPKTVTFTAAQLAAMNKTEVRAMSMSGESHVYTGIVVADILKAAAVIGPSTHRDNLTKYMLVRSADNYQVLFSLTELDSAFSGRTIILANLVDGKPLPESKGPYRMVVPGEEKRQARWIWGVTTFIIRITKE